MTMKSFCLSLALLALFTACRSDAPPSATLPPPASAATVPLSAATNVPEPFFVQEGVLELRAADGKRSLLRLHIEIAPSEGERQQGLMWRKTMAENQGMLFTFDVEAPQSFWMRNTYIPLDIIYVNANFEVVSIRKNTPVRSDAPQPSGVAAQYVIEVNAGVADKYKIGPGATVAWSDFTSGQAMGGFPAETPAL